MAIIGLLLISLGDGESAWLGLVAIPEFALAALFMRKFPSKSVIKENYRKKDEYLAEIRKIDEELVELNKQLSDISKMTVNR